MLRYCHSGWEDATVVASFYCLLSLVAFLCLLSTIIFPGCFPCGGKLAFYSVFVSVSFLPLLCLPSLSLPPLSSSVSKSSSTRPPRSSEAFYVMQFAGSQESWLLLFCVGGTFHRKVKQIDAPQRQTCRRTSLQAHKTLRQI